MAPSSRSNCKYFCTPVLAMKRRISLNIFLTVIILYLFLNLYSQAGRGTARLSGVVLDEDGKPVRNAKVIIVFGQPGGYSQETTTNKNGEWAFLGLGTGKWEITVNAEGFQSQTIVAYVKQLELNPKMTIKLQRIKKSSHPFLQEETTLEILEKAEELFKSGQYDEAIAQFQLFYEKNHQAYPVLLQIGHAYREKGDFETAQKLYNEVVEKAKTDSLLGKEMTGKALAAIGECFLRQNNYEEAKKFFEQSLEAFPDDEILAYNVGEIYFANARYKEALQYYDLAAKIKPNWPDPYLKMGYVYINLGEIGKAVEVLEKFLTLEPPDSERSALVKNILTTIKK